MEISYNYGAGADLSHAMATQAAMLSQHAHDLMQAGNALVSEHLIGQGGDAYLDSLRRLTSAVSDIGDTIMRHSSAVDASFLGANHVDATAANLLGG
ncbi:hypothetical protein JMUB5695_00040 [Mycobacterium heckeshornense]|uniref:hypothetical protein n=1 Tax=Mycobacterium heckeshornense TaxID=110505 RepID=UPI00194118D3|nr:hypothetical protein [Mycobacterium heckeshornense]BCQ06631.1 hypothetical protein JMUB5695_00040 [Mycobacterium heckeshornense]